MNVYRLLAGPVIWACIAGAQVVPWGDSAGLTARVAGAASTWQGSSDAAAGRWVRAHYGGGAAPTGRVPGYSVTYPTGWTVRLWPDSLAFYGLLQSRSPAGSVLDVMIVPLRDHGLTMAAVIAHDAGLLTGARRDAAVLPLGRALHVTGRAAAAESGRLEDFLYLRRRGLLYRFTLSYHAGLVDGSLLQEVARSLAIPVSPPQPPPPLPPSPPVAQTCCHCPPFGRDWGNVLTRVDGIPVYSNAGNVDNGCGGTYGILYQCVELVQRYFAVRWGYPAIWYGVYGAADMVLHHPVDIQFIPNGGSPGPRAGDALVFYGGGVGHVALVAHVDAAGGAMILAEENWSANGEAVLSLYDGRTVAIRNSAYGSYVVAGWLHSPRNASIGERQTRREAASEGEGAWRSLIALARGVCQARYGRLLC